MKVGILTYHHAINYGAILQAYGLQKVIQCLGHSAQIIDFRYTSDGFKPLRYFKRQALNILRLLQGEGLTQSSQVTEQLRKFEQFAVNRLSISPRVYSFDALAGFAERYDALVVGSDQIWNADFSTEPRLAYFLTFCKNKGVRKISYAPCFGQTNQPPAYLAALSELLKPFDHLSVRGAFGAEIIAKYTTRIAENVVDPTLLVPLDEVMIENSRYRDYVLIYSLSRHLARDFLQLANVLKKERGMAVVSVSPRVIYPFADYYAADAGPGEFLTMIKHAGYVLTNSYHGTVLSIKYRKPFIACNRSTRRIRIADVLTQFSLGERLAASAQDAVHSNLLHSEIDYGAVCEKMEDHIRRSLLFLERALS